MEEEAETQCCPLCVEEMDLSDKNFLPCPCGYKICMWCWHHIRENLNGLCPACRTPYKADPFAFAAVDRNEVIKKSKERRTKDKSDKKPAIVNANVAAVGNAHAAANGAIGATGSAAASARIASSTVDRRQLHNYRVVQRNLVYVIGIPAGAASEDTLRKPEYFGQYGKIGKVVIHRNHTASHTSVSAYVTFVYKEDARAAIQALDGFWLEGGTQVLRASFGTTKYCNSFIRGVPCSNPDCVYLHDLGDDDDRFTKEEIQAGHSKLAQVPGKDQSIVTGNGGPSGTGRKPAGDPVLPPPVFIQDNIPASASVSVPPPSKPQPVPRSSTWTNNVNNDDDSTNTNNPIAESANVWHSFGSSKLGLTDTSSSSLNGKVGADASLNFAAEKRVAPTPVDATPTYTSKKSADDPISNSEALRDSASSPHSIATTVSLSQQTQQRINELSASILSSLHSSQQQSHQALPQPPQQAPGQLSQAQLPPAHQSDSKELFDESQQHQQQLQQVLLRTIMQQTATIAPPTDRNFNGVSHCAVFPVPTSSFSVSIWAAISGSSGNNGSGAGEDLVVNPFAQFLLPVSELLDLTLPPVDAVGLPYWPRPLTHYCQASNFADVVSLSDTVLDVHALDNSASIANDGKPPTAKTEYTKAAVSDAKTANSKAATTSADSSAKSSPDIAALRQIFPGVKLTLGPPVSNSVK